MSEFNSFFNLGIHHILDWQAYDHMLFVVVLCAVYRLSQWRQILVLITAFTVGHTLTLLLSTLDVIRFPAPIVEFLIPLTIFTTAILNIFEPVERSQSAMMWHYLTAMGFGLIHGMGFSNYLRVLLGGEESILLPLLAFNVGLEVGQLGIVAVSLGSAFLALEVVGVKHRMWNLLVSGMAAVISLMLMIQAKFW
jgi:heme exporter protein D